MTYNILIVEDEILQSKMMAGFLTKKLHANVIEVRDGKEAVDYLKSNNPIDLVLMDLNMPIMDGKEALQQIRSFDSELPIIILTTTDTLSKAVEVMRLGASDFITKPFDPEQLQSSISRSLILNKKRKKVASHAKNDRSNTGFKGIIGANNSLKPAISMAEKAAKSEISVLISGESGTGKEVFARAIHHHSGRSESPFIAINCGAIPDNLVESILFGHEKGAFTGAIAKSIGKFREAEGGTLFLDEIGELKPEVQVKLLRALQQREIEPVGAGKPVTVDVRIISATHKELAKEVEVGCFRQDLFYRINVFPIILPPLRARKEDIELFITYFIEHFAAIEHKDIKGYNKEARAFLESYTWFGNIRELENVIFRAVVLCESERLELEHLVHIIPADNQASPEFGESCLVNSNNITNPPAPEFAQKNDLNIYRSNNSFKTLDELSDDYIDFILETTHQNIKESADILGIGQSTLYRKISEKDEKHH